jgi:hypothetical protein
MWAEQALGCLASAAVPAVRKSLAGQEWRAGDMVWLARPEGVTAAVIATATPAKLTLAMGSWRYAYEHGFSPSDPSLCHSKPEALQYLMGRSARS